MTCVSTVPCTAPNPAKAYRIFSFLPVFWNFMMIYFGVGQFSFILAVCWAPSIWKLMFSNLGKVSWLFCLIILSLPILYFCFLNSYYSDIGSLRLWKFFCSSIWRSPSTFSSYEFLFVYCVFYICYLCACACVYK